MVTDTTEGRAPRFRPGGRRGVLRQRLAALHEGDAHAARPCRDREAEGAPVRCITCRRNPWPSRDVRDGLALAVDADLELMNVGPDAGRFDFELVFSVQREIAVDLQPAARAERQCLIAAFLRLPHRRDVGVHQRTHVGIAHGHAADLERRCQIALHRRRRDKQRVSQIVEAAARVVGRQQRGVVELLGQIRQREQIADHVGVFGPRQAMRQRRLRQDWGATRRWPRARAPGSRPRACRTPAADERRPEAASFQRATDAGPSPRSRTDRRDARRPSDRARGRRSSIARCDRWCSTSQWPPACLRGRRAGSL